MPAPHPIAHAGHFIIGTNAPGAPTLNLILTVSPNSDIVTGHGVLTQATNPPLHANNSFHGVVHTVGTGTSAKQIYALRGEAVPPLLGAPHVTQLLIALDGIWGKEGKATYSYVIGSMMHEIVDVPVSVQWLLQS